MIYSYWNNYYDESEHSAKELDSQDLQIVFNKIKKILIKFQGENTNQWRHLRHFPQRDTAQRRSKE